MQCHIKNSGKIQVLVKAKFKSIICIYILNIKMSKFLFFVMIFLSLFVAIKHNVWWMNALKFNVRFYFVQWNILFITARSKSINIFLVKIVPLEINCFVANNHTYSMQCKRTIHLNHYFSKHNTTSIGIFDPNQVVM